MVDKLTIGLFDYSVEERDEVFTSEGGPAAGTCEQIPSRIVIVSGMTDLQTFHTLIHESLHAYDYQYGLSLSEYQILGLATAVMDFIRNNREFVGEI